MFNFPQADISYINGKPAARIPTRISATADGQPLEITAPTSTSDDEGKVSFEIHPEIHYNTISIELETEDPRYVGQQATGHFVQHRFQSANKAFVALERSSAHRTKVGDKFIKNVRVDSDDMKNLYYAVITKGKIVKMVKLREGYFRYQVIEFSITQDMVPSFRLVVWALHKDELLADSLNIDIEDTCPPEAEVFIEPRFEITEPGHTGFIHFTGTNSTSIGVLVVDNAVYALPENVFLTRAKVFEAMAKHDLGCGPGGGVTTDTVLGNSGILIATNKYTPKPGESFRSRRNNFMDSTAQTRSYIGKTYISILKIDVLAERGLNGYVNKQNGRIWSEANPQVYVETPLHPEKLNVWCALWAGGIIGPYFFKNDEGYNVTVNGDRYRAMITNFFIPELNNHDVQELRFQQDGATCHTARATIDLLKDTFGDHLISRVGPVNWPPRSCDLTPLDYFLWGYVKSLVYADKP
ncbi:complement C5 [Trichonephila clavipes]|nr:complement C5 [Trichonephila clavipes]